MNRSNSHTKNFNTPRYNTYTEKMRRRRRQSSILLGFLAVLIIILIIAIVFIIRDIVVKNREDKPVVESGAVSSAEITTGESAADHPIELAYDGNVSTYMLSPSSQAVGAWLQFDFGEVRNITYVGVVTNHETSFIRSADVEISQDGDNWTTVGELTGTPGNSAEISFTPPSAVPGRYARIILTSGASAPWAVNVFSARDESYMPLTPVSASMGIKKAPAVSETSGTVKNGYENRVYDYNDIFKGFLINVSNEHQYVFPPSDVNILTIYDNRTNFATNGGSLYSYQIGETKLVLLDATALRALNEMCDAFYRETGLNYIHVGSNCGYRSRQTQEELYAKYPATAAKPGTSDHNTGYGVNLNIYYNGTPYEISDTNVAVCRTTLEWLNANAYKYGFIPRYPAGKDSVTMGTESDRYHYRYVGYPHAYYMNSQNLCLEEYLDFLGSNAPYTGNHLVFTADDGNTYEIYYVPASGAGNSSVTVPVPANLPFTVSGNNYDGFIVTVTK